MKTSLSRLLNSVGKAIFVKHFHEFKNESLTPSEIISSLSRNYGYSEKASATRVSKARTIIRNNLSKSALQIIAESGRIDRETIDGANRLLKDLAKKQAG